MNIKKAFTLAEVLMVVGIVGTVATLAITNSRKESDMQEKIAQLRKSQTTIEAAIQASIDTNGEMKNWPTTDAVKTYIFPYLKLKKDCANTTSTACWKNKSIKGTAKIASSGLNIYSNTNYAKAILANGSSIGISFDSSLSNLATGYGYTGKYAGFVIVDVNGPKKGKASWGDDVFLFIMTPEDGLIPAGVNMKLKAENGCPTNLDLCTDWAISHGNQDYFKN